MDSKVKKLTTPEERLALDRVITIGFVQSGNPDAQLQKYIEQKDIPRLDDIWGVVDEGGNIGAAMNCFHYQAEFDGHVVPAGGVGAVCSLPEFRTKGGIRSIFKKQFKEQYEKGFVFSYLFPFSFPYYRQFGYEHVNSLTRYEIPLEAFSEYRCDYHVSMDRQGELLDDMKAVYYQFIKGKNLAIHRRDDQWGVAKGDPFTDRCYKYVFYNHIGEPRAYVVFHPEGGANDPRWVAGVKDIAFIAPNDFFQILGFMYRLRAQYGTFRVCLPEEVPMRSMVAECNKAKSYQCSHVQMRIINVQKALEYMQCPNGDGSVVIAVEDPFLEENTGNYVLKYADGRAVSVKKCQVAEPDIKLSIQRLSQLVIGYIDFAQAAYLSDIEVLHNHDILKQLFLRKPIFFIDHF